MRTYRNLGLTYHLVYQPDDIQVSGKTQKNIVGYDRDSVYVLADSKKKPLSGSSELRHTMTIPTPDVCADFAINVSTRDDKEPTKNSGGKRFQNFPYNCLEFL